MFAEKMEAAVSAVSAASEWDEELAEAAEDFGLCLIDIPTRQGYSSRRYEDTI